MTENLNDLANSATELVKDKKPNSLEEILESFENLNDDIQQISKLKAQERQYLAQFFASLQKCASITHLIPISVSALQIYDREVTQACLYPNGQILVTFEDGQTSLIDLTDPNNYELVFSVAEDLLQKIQDLSIWKLVEEPPKAPLSEPLPVASPALPPAATPEVQAAPAIDLQPQPEEPHVEPVDLLVDPSGLSAEEKAKIDAITADVLGNLEALSSEVFEYEPISRYFDDWMVNLRQTILLFEGNGIVPPDEAFTKECTQIFANIEEELAKRLLDDAELEASTKSLAEDKQLLGEIDAGYAAQTKDLIVKGKSAIDFLIRNVQHLEEELAEIEQVKTSYLHPMKTRAKEQKQAELKLKLRDAKKRLAMAVQTSSVSRKTAGDIDAEYAEQTKELKENKKKAIALLRDNVRELEQELDKLMDLKAHSHNFVKNMSRDAEIYAATQKLNEAQRSLRLAEESSNEEQRKLEAEYAEKKKATVAQMQCLEKEITNKKPDKSIEARQAATRALEEAVKSLIKRKTEPQAATCEEQTIESEVANQNKNGEGKPL